MHRSNKTQNKSSAGTCPRFQCHAARHKRRGESNREPRPQTAGSSSELRWVGSQWRTA